MSKSQHIPRWLLALELQPVSLLVWKGTQNSRLNADCQKVLRQRGQHGAARYLAEYQRKVLKNAAPTVWQPQTNEVPHGHWLDRTPEPKAPCMDCGTDTRRTYNGYHQCQTCANAIKRHGSRLNLEQARLVREAVVQQRLEEYEGKPAREVQEAKPIDRKDGAVAALDEGIQAANAELYEIGKATYNAAKAGPVGQAVAALKEGNKNVSAA